MKGRASLSLAKTLGGAELRVGPAAFGAPHKLGNKEVSTKSALGRI